MEKKTITKLVASAAILGLSVWGASGWVGGHDVAYQKPGPYTAEATNDFSTVQVDATIKGQEITDCVITSSGDNDLMTDAIRQEWAQAIVDAQSADTDVITGASLKFSAASVKECVDDILVQAGIKDASEIEAPAEAPSEKAPAEVEEPATEEGADAPAEAGAYADGSYSAEAANDFSTVKVDATIEGGKIADCAITSSGDNDLMTDATRQEWAQAIVDAQSADADAITGATLTFSAASVKECVDDILAQASGDTGTPAEGSDDERIAELEARVAELEAAASQAEARVAELEAAAASGISVDAMKYMRPRPVFEAAASIEEAPAEETASEDSAVEADPAMKYMRPRPSFAAGSAEKAEEAPAQDSAAEADPAMKYMRERPAFAAASAEEASSEGSAVEADPAMKYMRERPAFAAASTGEAAEATDESPVASADAMKYMRQRPAFAAASAEEAPAEEATDESPAVSGDAMKYMRERPAFAAASEEEASVEETADESPAVSADAVKYMRERPAFAAASEEEAPVEETADESPVASADAMKYMRQRPAFAAASEEEAPAEEAAEEASAEEAVETASADADLSAALPAIVVSMGANRENSYVTDYLEQDPYLVNIYEGYGFAKDYGSARGHEYTLEDVAKTQRPHPKANCLTCKTPDFHKLVEQEGLGVYSMPFDDVMAQMTTNINCYTCHGDDAGNGGALVVTHQYVNEALGGNVGTINPATLSCGQCHIEYYFTPSDSETMMPYDSVEAMAPEAILAYYDKMDFADWTQESTGTRLLKAQHPEMETFLAGKHANFLSCADCHMPMETTDTGVAYHSHELVSPLQSEALLQTCAACHRDTDMVELVHGIQEKVTARETEVGNKLSGMKDKLAEAVASGTWSEEDLNAVRTLHRQAQWYFDFCYVENSEGAHNSELAMRCLDTSDALIDEALKLLDK